MEQELRSLKNDQLKDLCKLNSIPNISKLNTKQKLLDALLACPNLILQESSVQEAQENVVQSSIENDIVSQQALLKQLIFSVPNDHHDNLIVQVTWDKLTSYLDSCQDVKVETASWTVKAACVKLMLEAFDPYSVQRGNFAQTSKNLSVQPAVKVEKEPIHTFQLMTAFNHAEYPNHKLLTFHVSFFYTE